MYNELYAAWRHEVTEVPLGALPPDFYQKLAAYLKAIKAENRADQKTLKISLLDHEARNVQRMLEELLSVRYRKIIKATTKNQKVPTELLTAEEAKMTETFADFAGAYDKFSESLLQGEAAAVSVAPRPEPIKVTITGGKTETPPQPTQVHVVQKRLTLRFNKAIPAIMGADMKSYGPYAPEDVASLPELNARILIKQGLATLIEVT